SYGTGGRCAAVNDQCPSHGAPCRIQRFSSSTCSAVSFGFFDFGGGIRSSGSSDVILLMISLSSGWPATTGVPFSNFVNNPSFVSSRRSALRLLLSGPWQAKQFSERRGAMSRLNLTGDSAAAAVGAADG